MYIQAENLSNAFVRVCHAIKENGVEVVRRGKSVTEIPGAVLIEISNPTDRYIRVPERKWNKTLGWIESLWLARGDNSLDMPASYVKNLLTFSDDGYYMRAGYGPRIRRFGDNFSTIYASDGEALSRQYKNGKTKSLTETTKHYSPTPSQTITDQLRFVVAKFKEDLDTREACITIHDPIADDFNAMNTDPVTNYTSVLRTKDTPCTRSIHFMVVGGKMNCYVDMRSNDVWWGFSAVNVFNFTLMQEYVANIVGVPIGKYYHKVDNIHVYDNFLEKLVQIANKYPEDSFPSGLRYEYKTTFNSLQAFDKLVNKLSEYEELCRNSNLGDYELRCLLDKFKDPLFNDWARIICRYWTKQPIIFENPFLNELFI